MAERLVLHVGTMKSGTTYLQRLLYAQKDELAAAGVLVPGDGPSALAAAVNSILRPGTARIHWDALVAQIAAYEGTVLGSHEFLGPAADGAARRILDSLPAGLELHVVVTARDLNRTLVSMWQETIQNGRSWPWEDYLKAARDTAPGTGRGIRDKSTAGGTFWRQQHVARILADWAGRVGADHVTLVTVPPPGVAPEMLAQRFADAARVPLRTMPATVRANESLGLASVLVLRELNAALEQRGIIGADGRALRKSFIAKTALAQLAHDEPRLGLAVPDWVRHQTDATVGSIRSLGVRVIGDLADLHPVDVPGVQPDEVSAAHRARAATAALVESIAHHPDVRTVRPEPLPEPQPCVN